MNDALEKRIPELRFTGFNGAWETKPIEKVLIRRSKPVNVDAEKLYTQIGLRSHGKGIFHKESVTGESLGSKRVFWVQPNCLVINIVFAWEQAVGKTTEREVGLIASHRFPMYSPMGDQAISDFIVRFFLRPRGKYLLGLASPGGAGRNRTLGQKEFEKLKVAIPTLPEQRKIADFLTAVDGRIQQLIQKKALLEDYKKGVMQQLFTQTLRFKDDHGNDFPDWEEKKLGEVVEVNPKTATIPNSFTYIDLESVTDGQLNSPRHILKSEAPSRAQRLLQKGDILYQTVRPYQMNNYMFNLNGVCVASTGYAQLRASEHNSEFVYQLVHLQSFVGAVLDRCTGTSYPAINSKDLAEIQVSMPHSAEQTKIADFLSAIDRKIESVANQITQTQTFKRGLLQRMFV